MNHNSATSIPQQLPPSTQETIQTIIYAYMDQYMLLCSGTYQYSQYLPIRTRICIGIHTNTYQYILIHTNTYWCTDQHGPLSPLRTRRGAHRASYMLSKLWATPRPNVTCRQLRGSELRRRTSAPHRRQAQKA